MTDYIYQVFLKFKSMIVSGSSNLVLENQNTLLANQLKELFLNFVSQNARQIASIEDWLKDAIGTPHNYFSEDDNLTFQSLEFNPVFTYFMFQTFLKYMLTNGKMYESLAEFYLPNEFHANDMAANGLQNVISQQDLKALPKKLVIDEINRINRVTEVLISMPEFHHFLQQHGDFVFETIKDQFLELKTKKENHVTNKPYNQKLIDAISIEEMTQTFLGISIATLAAVEKTNGPSLSF